MRIRSYERRSDAKRRFTEEQITEFLKQAEAGGAAAQLGVDRTTLSKVLHGRAAISPSMALRIERWLGRDHGGVGDLNSCSA